MEITVSLHEHEELNKASSSLCLDSQTKALALSLLTEYKQKSKKQEIGEELPLVVGCAILAASKSQVLTNLKGEQIKGIGITIPQLMRAINQQNGTVNIDEFLMMLKYFITSVPLSSEINAELKTIIDKFAFSYIFFIKYNNLFKQLDLKDQSHDEDYIKNLRNFGWLIYLNAKSAILQNKGELLDCIFLLTATLGNLLYHIPNSVSISYLEKSKNLYDRNTKKKNEEAIQDGICELLKINVNNCEDIQPSIKALNEYLHKLIAEDVIRSHDGSTPEGMYDPKIIVFNYNKLETYYQKKLNADDLDEGFFIKERKPHTPGKFTPFAKQGAANKLVFNANPNKATEFQQSKKVYSSHRMLNYEVSEQVNMKTQLSEIKFSANKSVPQSPFTRLQPATPMTRALEMYNWLSDKVRIKKTSYGLTSQIEKYMTSMGDKSKEYIVNRANSIVETVLNYEKESTDSTLAANNQKKLKDKHNQIVNLYLRVLEELLLQEEKKTKNPNYYELLSNDNFHKSLIACSIETVNFVLNSSNVIFTKLLELCDIQAFEFWRIIGSFIKFDNHMPSPIKKNLLDLEIRILMSLAWKKDSIVHEIIKSVMNDGNPMGIENEKFSKIVEVNESPRSIESNDSTHESTKIMKSNNSSGQKSAPSSNVTLLIENHSDSVREKKRKVELTHSQEVTKFHIIYRKLFFKRVLHFTAMQVHYLCEGLQLSEKISEHVWTVMKYILSSETTLLIERHIDQLILSTLYGVCKVFHQPLKFQEIILRYQELPNFNRNDYQEIIHGVYINDKEKADLIKFYNSVYIAQMKAFLFSLAGNQNETKPVTPLIKKPLIQALVMESPLRESIPFHMMHIASVSQHNKIKSPMLKMGMTPQTSALYAFAETPARSAEGGVNSFSSRRQLNFEDPQEQSDIGSKKLKYNHPIMDKIIEQRAEEGDNDSSKKVVPKKNIITSPAQLGNTGRMLKFDDTTSTIGQNQLSTQNSTGTMLNFSQMQVPNKAQFGFQINKNTKMNMESAEGNNVPHNYTGNISNHDVNIPKFKKDDSLTPEFKK